MLDSRFSAKGGLASGTRRGNDKEEEITTSMLQSIDG